jgi:hypothetical protein
MNRTRLLNAHGNPFWSLKKNAIHHREPDNVTIPLYDSDEEAQPFQ